MIKTPRLNRREVDFIYDFCQCYLRKETNISRPQGIRDEVIYDYLRKNGCTGIFFKFLEDTGFQIPVELMEAYRGEYFSIEMNNTVYMKEAERVAGVCRRSGIGAVMMKGTALIESVYREKGLRPLSDIDLIVSSRRQALRLMELLQSETHPGINFAGRFKDYLRTSGTLYNKQYDRTIEMEVYFPVEACYYPFPELFFNISGRLFKGGRAQRVNNLDIPEPSSHFLVLLVHLVHHHLGARLIWNLDMACLVNEYPGRMDWDFILYECRRLEYKDTLFHILRMLKEKFGLDIPGKVLDEAGRGRGFNHGILKEMVSADNVIMDSLGGGKIWQFPALSLKKSRTIILYSGCLFLFNDQLYKWYTFNLGSKRKKRLMGELIAIFFFKHKYTGRKSVLKKIFGVFFVFLFSLIALPILLYYNFKKKNG